MREKSAILPTSKQGVYSWQDILAKAALLLFSIAFWFKELSSHTYIFAHCIVVLAWILDGGLSRFKEMIKEPFVAAILILCIVMALGIFWNDDFKREFKVLRRYTVFLIFIPYLALLHKERLPWAIGDLFMNCFMILVMVMVPLSPPNHNFLCSHTQGYIKIITPNDHSIRESNLFFSELTNLSNTSSNASRCLFITGLT